jgi:hypothetical protein
MLRRIVFAVVAVTCFSTPVFAARNWGRRVVASNSIGRVAATTAQDVANMMANSRTLLHSSNYNGYEGVGVASTKQEAYDRCCYSRSGMSDHEVGFAYSNGMWYCCRRYR